MVFPWGWVVFKGICDGGLAALCGGASNVSTQVAKWICLFVILLSHHLPFLQRWLLALKLHLGNPGWEPQASATLQVTLCSCCVTWRCRAQHGLSCSGDQNLWLVACLCHLIKSTCCFCSLSPLHWCWTSWQRYREERDQSKVSEQLGQILGKNSAFYCLKMCPALEICELFTNNFWYWFLT